MSSGRTRRPNGGKNLYALPLDYVAVDTETTGLDFDWCDLIEIGAVRVENGEVVDKFDSLINIGYSLDPFIVDLTGITDAMLKSAPPVEKVIPAFANFIGDSVLLAHNASFDMNFLYTAFEKVLDEPLTNDYVDSLRVARRAFPEMKHRRLPDLCNVLGVTNDQEHRALSDILATVECYQQMRDIVISRFGSEDGYVKSFSSSGGSGRSQKATDIVATVDDIDDTNPLYQVSCVFTGKMTSMVRKDAMQLLANVGGIPQDRVTRETDYLVVGNDGFSDALKKSSGKIKKAKADQLKGLPIQIISEDVFLSMLDFH
jgi:DNA polymerase-3 subunit epsilon